MFVLRQSGNFTSYSPEIKRVAIIFPVLVVLYVMPSPIILLPPDLSTAFLTFSAIVLLYPTTAVLSALKINPLSNSTHTPTRGVTLHIVYAGQRYHNGRTLFINCDSSCSHKIHKSHIILLRSCRSFNIIRGSQIRL